MCAGISAAIAWMREGWRMSAWPVTITCRAAYSVRPAEISRSIKAMAGSIAARQRPTSTSITASESTCSASRPARVDAGA